MLSYNNRKEMPFCDKIEVVGDWFGFDLVVLKTGKERAAESKRLYREKNKEKIAESKRIYQQENKEKIAEKSKKYRENNKEILSEKKKIYRENNKEILSEKRKIYRENNKEKIKEYLKKYILENKEKITDQRKEYRAKNRHLKDESKKSPAGRKSNMITNWKYKGLIHDDYSKLYDDYLLCSKCDVCDKEFKTRRDKCMDHDHLTGLFRHFLCQSCNNQDYWKKVINNKINKK
jgi:hypothetical protein